MSRNLIICADGTGNKGGYTPDSNVYKIYHCIDLHSDTKQIAFYDNGVGTSSNKFLKALTGALGFGFKRNVKELYRYLSRTYEDDDKLFFFGFSRGAATVRSCIAMVSTMGLVEGKNLDPQQLDHLVDVTFDYYARVRRFTEPEQKLEREGLLKEYNQKLKNLSLITKHPRIHFVGVWDTVAALGFPKRLRVTGLLSKTLDNIFQKLDWLLDMVFNHRFYAYDLPETVENAYQALAIDDQRKTFWPLVWDETDTKSNVEQVWFAGVHSNVGGGYERQGLADISLYWMLVRAQAHDLVFNEGLIGKVEKDANNQGYLYDSRAGFAAFYRYYPRDLTSYYEANLLEAKPVRIHESAINRIALRIGEYAPIILPGKFDVVESNLKPNTTIGIEKYQIDLTDDNEWQFQDKQVREGVEDGINMYWWFIWITLFAVLLPGAVELICPSCTEVKSLLDLLDYWMRFYISDYQFAGLFLFLIYGSLLWFNKNIGDKISYAAYKIGRIVVANMKG